MEAKSCSEKAPHQVGFRNDFTKKKIRQVDGANGQGWLGGGGGGVGGFGKVNNRAAEQQNKPYWCGYDTSHVHNIAHNWPLKIC